MPPPAPDIEDIAKMPSPNNARIIRVQKKKRKRDSRSPVSSADNDASSWQEALGPPPSCDNFQVRFVK